jgi:hypothetical protein
VGFTEENRLMHDQGITLVKSTCYIGIVDEQYEILV